MKKIVMMGWIASMLAVGAGGCVEEPIASGEESPALAEEARILEDSPDSRALAEGARLAAQHRAARLAEQVGRPMELLALEERTSSASGQLKDEALAAAGVSCGDWSDWRTVDTYCEWATLCWWGDATYLVRERSRGCYSPGNSFVDWDYTSVRGGCGC